MRAFVDIVQNLTSSIRFIIGAVVVGLMAVGLFMTIGATYVSHKAVDSIGERVERLGEEAIRAEQDARRDRVRRHHDEQRHAAQQVQPFAPGRR